MRRALLRCYPRRWRARYGEEFAALLEERSLGPFDVIDVLLGALDAHLHLRGLGAAAARGRGLAMSLRIGGFAALLGGLLWFIGLAGSSATDADGLFAALALLATISLLVAMVGLGAFQARRSARLSSGHRRVHRLASLDADLAQRPIPRPAVLLGAGARRPHRPQPRRESPDLHADRVALGRPRRLRGTCHGPSLRGALPARHVDGRAGSRARAVGRRSRHLGPVSSNGTRRLGARWPPVRAAVGIARPPAEEAVVRGGVVPFRRLVTSAPRDPARRRLAVTARRMPSPDD